MKSSTTARSMSLHGRTHRTGPGSCRRQSWLAVLLVGTFAAAPVAAQEPVLEGVFQVRSGTLIRACGGFTGRCQGWTLSGTLTFEADPPRITASDLRVAPLGTAQPFAFPAASDVALTALEGSAALGEVTFESSAGAPQTVGLRVSPFGDVGGEAVGWFLEGTYDEGCCDRFVVDFGLTPLLPAAVEGALSLQGGRFQVTVDFRTFEDEQGEGVPIQFDDQSGAFWFFDPDNPELFVKVLDACAISGRYWIFIAGLTNVEVNVAVFDQQNDFVPVYGNELGDTFETVLDTQGFPCDGGLPGGVPAP